MEIKNTAATPIAVIAGDPAAPTDVKVLKPGETYHSDAYPLTVVDDTYADLKNRRAPDQPFSGRRKADPNVDQRQIVKSPEQADREAKVAGKAKEKAVA